ncbi:hypothetical protein HDU86_001926 [Geranomyces michiganensis]|nr:hypothetical protein HDU86_001926 [Geranomyces michiganensis]
MVEGADTLRANGRTYTPSEREALQSLQFLSHRLQEMRIKVLITTQNLQDDIGIPAAVSRFDTLKADITALSAAWEVSRAALLATLAQGLADPGCQDLLPKSDPATDDHEARVAHEDQPLATHDSNDDAYSTLALPGPETVYEAVEPANASAARARDGGRGKSREERVAARRLQRDAEALAKAERVTQQSLMAELKDVLDEICTHPGLLQAQSQLQMAEKEEQVAALKAVIEIQQVHDVFPEKDALDVAKNLKRKTKQLAAHFARVLKGKRGTPIRGTEEDCRLVNDAEIAKFAKAAAEWWNPKGEFEMLHRMNPVRVRYVRDTLARHATGELAGVVHATTTIGTSSLARPFDGLRILDIGCGGGLLSEALARLGATVVGADAAGENIAMAKIHAQQDPALTQLEYRHVTAEKLLEDREQFDIVCALEIIEHVNNPREFTRVCSQLVKPNGLIFFSTINRTPASYLFTILLAEHVLRWVPPGTHDHAKYITPQEMDDYLVNADCEPLETRGMAFDPLRNRWRLLSGDGFGDLQMNYIVGARRLAKKSMDEEEAAASTAKPESPSTTRPPPPSPPPTPAPAKPAEGVIAGVTVAS